MSVGAMFSRIMFSRVLILAVLLPTACKVPGSGAGRADGHRGTLWATLDVPTDDLIVAVKSIRPGTILTVAAHGGVFQFTDSNALWTRLSQDLLQRKGEWSQAHFQAAFILDEDHVWAARGYSTDEDVDPFIVYDFSKSRGAWSELHVQNAHRLRVNAIHFWDPQEGVLFAHWEHCLKTQDGGKSWSKRRWPVSDGEVIDRDHLFGTGPGRPVANLQERREELVYFSRSGGSSWEPTPQNVNEALPGLWTINGIRFLDRRRGWVFGHTREANGRIRACLAMTADAGAHWAQLRNVPIPPQTDYSSLIDLCFRDEQEGWVILNSTKEKSNTNKCAVTILGTKDGGTTWTEEWMNPTKSPGVPVRFAFLVDGTPVGFGSQGLLLKRKE